MIKQFRKLVRRITEFIYDSSVDVFYKRRCIRRKSE